MSRRALSVAVLVAALAGCGDGEDVIDQDQLRDCLAGEGLSLEAAGYTTSAVLGNVSPDFRAHFPDGAAVDFVVEGTEEKARRKAADVRGALQSFGVTTKDRLLTQRNAIAVFERAPSPKDRARVAGCLD